MVWEPSRTNKIIKILGYVTLVSSVIAAIVILTTLKVKEPDQVLPLTGYVIEGDEINHPYAWLYALLVLFSGVISSVFFFAISEALTRLQNIEIYSEKSFAEIESMARIRNVN